MIQNLGVIQEHRRTGIGAALLAKALDGFARVGAVSVSLEVTAQNIGAMRLYRSFGFRPVRTIYKSVPQLDTNPSSATFTPSTTR
jgi:ribosomal protein S18 acetylase RimI-like enzyme